jgi:DNA-binding HxlR family transcriptional regulator
VGRTRTEPLNVRPAAPLDGRASSGAAAATLPARGIAGKVRASPVTRAIRVLGDRWSLLVIRDAFQGVRRFEQLLSRTGASRATLTRRLRALVAADMLERVRYSNSPPRWEYRLTPRGRELFPLSMVAWDWERRWAPRGAGIPLQLRHAECGATLEAVTVCAHCGQPLHLRDVALEPRPGVNARALPRMARSRRISPLTAASQRGTHDSLTHIADLVGDPWTPLLLAAAFFGVRRFDDFQRELGIASNILATRLDLLVRRRVLARRPYQRQPLRHEYRLTDKGRELFPYAAFLNDWGERWLLGPAGSPQRFVHRPCGATLVPSVRCARCDVPLRQETVRPLGRRRSASA